ncbi:MAG TPA: hypothetical protein VFM54_02865 [Micromonosporaceae bacterium]|nr:hypothetical protein [Micromonosporaceae bacterium]
MRRPRHDDRRRKLVTVLDATTTPVRWSLVEHPDDLARLCRQVGGPVVVKPVDGAGSFGVTVARDETEARAQLGYVTDRSRRGVAIAEAYLAGRFAIGTGVLQGVRSVGRLCAGLASVVHLSPLLPAGTEIHSLDANWCRAGSVLARGDPFPDQGDLDVVAQAPFTHAVATTRFRA